MTREYVHSAFNAARALRDEGWSYHLLTYDGADIITARNFLANKALANGRDTHILFIDSDMSVDISVFKEFLLFNKQCIGTVYPKRHLDRERYAQARLRGHDDETAIAQAVDFNVRLLPGPIRGIGRFCPVEAIGFGCVLLECALLRQMISQGVAPRIPSGDLTQLGLADMMFDFFSLLPAGNGAMLSEDYSFCRRVRQLEKGQVWAYVGDGVGHIGGYDYGASFMARLRGDGADNIA